MKNDSTRAREGSTFGGNDGCMQDSAARMEAQVADRIALPNTKEFTEPCSTGSITQFHRQLQVDDEGRKADIIEDDVCDQPVLNYNEAERDVVGVTETKRHKYQMPKQYAQFITQLLRNNPDIDRCNGRNLMLVAFRLTNSDIPLDVPTEDQVRRRITGIKYRLEKKESMPLLMEYSAKCHYIISVLPFPSVQLIFNSVKLNNTLFLLFPTTIYSVSMLTSLTTVH